MAIAKESTLAGGLSRQLDQRAQNGKVLFRSTFDDGFDGWRDHYGGVRPYPAVGLTSYPVMRGSHALMLSTGSEVPYSASSAANDASTYKNLSMYQVAGKKVSFSGFFAIGGEGGAFAWQSWGLLFDIQAWDNSWRSFFALRCKDRNGQGSDALGPAWYLGGGDGAETVISGSSSFPVAGENENKFNFNYVRLTIDMAANANQGGYYECQINNRVVDLRNLGTGGAATPRPSLTPQAGTPIDSFAGGFNAGLSILRRWRTPTLGAAILYADDLLCTIED